MEADQLIAKAGGATVLSALLGLERSSVSKWGARGRIPAERVPAIEQATGIPRHEIRPDLWPQPRPGETA